MKNLGYFFQEIKRMIHGNLLSSFLALISLIMIFFILISAGASYLGIGNWIHLLEKESEVSVFFSVDLNSYALEVLLDEIYSIDGVNTVTYISQEEALGRMNDLLGMDAKVLDVFEENPFEAFIELQIDLSKRHQIVMNLETLNHVTYVRDNKDILDQLELWMRYLLGGGIFLGGSVVLATLLITSHIVREGLYRNKSQINTLQLLGAPSIFILTPYLIQGLSFSLLASMISLFTFSWGLKSFFNSLYSFVFEQANTTFFMFSLIVLLFGGTLGFFSSLWGVKSIKRL